MATMAMAARCGIESLNVATASTSSSDKLNKGRRFTTKRPANLFSSNSTRQQLPRGLVLCQSSSPSKAKHVPSTPSIKDLKWQSLESAYFVSPSTCPAQQPSTSADPEVEFKGWQLRDGSVNHRVVAKLQNLAALCADRSEMHEILGVQRDNWNTLFNVTLSLATVSAAVLASIQGALHAPSLSITAFMLDAAAAGIMTGLNKFQPSQLAEEQRTAARYFKNIVKEIETTLRVDPRMRENANLFLEEKIERMQALDKAFPLPLLPLVLEKFPNVLAPSVMGPVADTSLPELPVVSLTNGWTSAIEGDLKQVAQRLRASDGDVEEYLGLMKKYLGLNKVFASISPALAAMGAAAALVGTVAPREQQMLVACAAAGFSVMSTLSHSLSNCFQLGMVFEMYRNCAGFYMGMESSIQRSLRMPVEMREDGELLHQKIAFQLGRPDQLPLVPKGDKLAGKLF